MIGKFPAVFLNFNRLFSQSQPIGENGFSPIIVNVAIVIIWETLFEVGMTSCSWKLCLIGMDPAKSGGIVGKT